MVPICPLIGAKGGLRMVLLSPMYRLIGAKGSFRIVLIYYTNWC